LKINIQNLKSKVDIISVIENAGVELKRQGSRHAGLCPFHNEKTPSFFVFPNERFKCFGCGESGDSIDFVQKRYGLSFPDALKHLGVDNQDWKITPGKRKEIEQRKRKADLVRAFRTWERKKADELAILIRCIRKVMKKWKTTADLELYGQILQGLPLYEYQLSLLIFGNDQEKLKFYKEAQKCRNRVLSWEKNYKRVI